MASRTSRPQSVASDLEAIFAPLPRFTPVVVPAPAAAKRGLRPWLLFLAAVAVVALVGTLLFLRPVAQQPSRRHASAPLAARPAPAVPAPATAPPASVPVQREAQVQPVETPVRREAPVRHARCPRFATEAWCLHGTIMAADDRLRETYAEAVRAGVPRDILVDIRSDWSRLRGRANRDPQALIRGYAELTQELRAEIER